MQIVPRSFRFVSFCFVAGGGRRGKDREEISKKFLNREGRGVRYTMESVGVGVKRGISRTRPRTS